MRANRAGKANLIVFNKSAHHLLEAAVVLSALAWSTSIAEAAVKTSEFASMKSILLEPFSEDTIVAVPLDSEVYDSVKPDLSDIRIVAGSSIEVPFLVEKEIETRTRVTKKIAQSTVASLREMEGNRLEMNLSLDEDAPAADLLRIHTPLSNFERRISVDGSADGMDWEQLVDGALIFDYSRYFDIENTDVELPKNEHRKFRVLIEDIIDEKASPFRTLWSLTTHGKEVERSEGFIIRSRHFRIDRIDLWAKSERETFESERTQEYPVRGFKVSRNEEEQQTIVEIDCRKEPLTNISIGSSTRNFSRRARLEVEEERRADTRWVQIGSAILTAINFLDYSKESLAISFPEHRAAKYRLTIEDQDNAPLAIESVTGKGRIYAMLFIGEPGASYDLYYDSERAKAPRYDIATVLAPIRHTYISVPASLGPESPNPAYNSEADKPPSTLLENKLFLTGVILAMVLILAWALFSTSRKMSGSHPSSLEPSGD